MKQVLVLISFFFTLGATAQSNGDCRTSICYGGYNLVSGFAVNIKNSQPISCRYDIYYPGGEKVRTGYVGKTPIRFLHRADFKAGIIRVVPIYQLQQCPAPWRL